MKQQGFTLVEILIVMVIVGLGLMTVAPKLAENTILSNKTESFFDTIIENHLETAKELNTQVFITGYKGSDNILLHSGERLNIPEGVVSQAQINDDSTGSSEFRIYFYPDGLFDHFRITFTNRSVLEGYPALSRAVFK